MIKKMNVSSYEREWIADAFASYPYESASFIGFKDQEMIKRYILLHISIMRSYCDLYSIDDKAIMFLSDEKSSTPFFQYIRMLISLFMLLGPKRIFSQMEVGTSAGFSQEVELRKKKIPFLHIEMLAVHKASWNEGYMSKLLNEAKAMADERKCVLIVETDEKRKKERYEHAGFELKNTRRLSSRASIFDLCYDPSKNHTG